MAYINNLGGTVSKDLVDLAKSLWMWCLELNIHITAQHLRGVQNMIANADYDRSIRLAAESSDIQHDSKQARSLCSGNRCLPVGLVSNQGVCQSTLESDRSGPVQSTEGSGPHCAGGTSLDYPLLLQMLSAVPHLVNHDHTMLNRDPEDLVPQLAVWHISGR